MQRMMVVALVPALITAAVLVTLLTQHQLVSLRDLSRSNADAIATQTASVSVQPLRNQQLRELLRIADSIGDLPHVTRVQIRTADGQILADHRESGSGTAAAENLTVVHDVTDVEGSSTRVLGSVLVDVSLHDAIAAQRASLQHALLALLLSLLIAMVIGWQAARWISAPLRHLAGAVSDLGRGEREVAVKVTDRTEIGELQQGFNHAAAALRDIHLGMEQQIAQATRELASKNAALEAASAARARFLAAASHDLRQPLYALTLLSSALAVDESDPLRLNRIAHLQECVQSLDHLFSELLDLSRLESGAVEVEISDFPLDPVLFEVIRSFDMVAEQRGLQLRGRHTGHWVRGDRTMLLRMLHNLVSNALRYTHLGGALLGARRDASGGIRIEIWDTGSGISPEHLDSIFDEFYRVGDLVDQRLEDGANAGLGLGLATAQRLAELMNTRVQLKSRLGRGSLFHFCLPAAKAPAPRLKLAPDVPTELAGRRVLVMDDDPAILTGIGFLLRSWGCEVAVAEDRLQALEAIENWPGPADLVISDLRLRAGENALQVFAELDERYRLDGEKPFARLLITGETRPAHLREIIAARIPLLYKPVSPQQLASTMAAALATPRR
jgi:signal transduction histidine kinase